MIKSLFGGKKKKEGYFLELDESEENQSDSSTVTPESEAPAKPVEEKQSEPVKSEAKKENKKPKPQKNKKTSIKTASTSKASTYDQPEWVKLLYKNNQNGKVESEPDNTFATKYLMTGPAKSRRRPGPSMKSFLEMARKTGK